MLADMDASYGILRTATTIESQQFIQDLERPQSKLGRELYCNAPQSAAGRKFEEQRVVNLLQGSREGDGICVMKVIEVQIVCRLLLRIGTSLDLHGACAYDMPCLFFNVPADHDATDIVTAGAQ